ncbi:hypothetical protein CK203_032226 [Vitis vinifera]|uniref:Uncharacterized protein n=1 Tax=Vitis vinifera TaxID=29760 RepID=A0A438DVY3_VITVI|nr:hypothetical protein CK203_112368 [Vitis vinifera]RVW98557.1 hypothetical protein CK203_032226 [Vitis vinifera]
MSLPPSPSPESFASLSMLLMPCDALQGVFFKAQVQGEAKFLQLRLNRDGFIIGTEYLSDLVEKEHADHKHGNILVHSTPMF